MSGKFLWRGLVPVAALSLVLVACGGGGGGSSDSSTSASSSSGSSSSKSSSSSSSSKSSSSSSSSSLDSNAVAVNVSNAMGGVNQPLVSVKVCVPGTDTCQTVENVLLDTGSSGLRLFASALDSTLVSALTAETDSTSGNALGECAQFGSGNMWGSVKQVDLVMNGETASSLPIHIVGDSDTTYTAPSKCSNLYTKPTQLGANGILGVNQLTADCGSGCESVAGIMNPWYYACTSSGTCTAVGVATADQIQQPVTYFATDNNGIVLVMDSVPDSGAASVGGILYFGIGTQSNNSPVASSVTVYDTDEYGDFETTANVVIGSTTYTSSYGFTDTGSNGWFIPGSITSCSGNSSASGWFCPTSTTSVTANLQGSGSAMSVDFSIANAETLFATSGYYAFNNLGASASSYIDLGMPFFFGRTVYLGINGADTTLGTGPFIAY